MSCPSDRSKTVSTFSRWSMKFGVHLLEMKPCHLLIVQQIMLGLYMLGLGISETVQTCFSCASSQFGQLIKLRAKIVKVIVEPLGDPLYWL